jgi:transcriptional regulator with XRE-family HTH domain
VDYLGVLSWAYYGKPYGSAMEDGHVGDERSAGALDRRLGLRVRTRRLEIGMSQERLAEALGVTFQQVQKYEKGSNCMAASRLFDVARALDMPVARFFDAIPFNNKKVASAEKASSAVHDVLATAEGVELVTLFAAIQSRKVRRRVVELVRVVTESPERV